MDSNLPNIRLDQIAVGLVDLVFRASFVFSNGDAISMDITPQQSKTFIDKIPNTLSVENQVAYYAFE